VSKSFITAAALVIALMSSRQSFAVVVDFDGLPATQEYVSGTFIPSEARLSGQLISSVGAKFSSSGGYVGVVRLGMGHATSGENGIGGSTVDGDLTYSPTNSIVIAFFDPANPAQPAITDFVSVRGDLHGSGLPIGLKAFDVVGNEVASTVAFDNGGTVLSITHSGIHSIQFLGTMDDQGVALDDVTFNTVIPVEIAVSSLPWQAVKALYR
jgi:hypothetical protein